MNLVITDSKSLLYLIQKKPRQVSLDLRELTKEENKKYERELNSQLFNCGCKSGRSYIFRSVPGIILLAVAGLGFGLVNLWELILFVFILILLSGFIGKLKSLNESRKEIKRIVSEILLLT